MSSITPVAVRDGDPNGNGQKDEIALEFCENDWCTHILEYAGFWGFTKYYKTEDGKFIATPLTDDFRAFLEYFHKLAQEGLLDVEGFSQTNQQWQTKAKDDRCFMFYTWTANGLFEEEKANEYEVFKPVQAGTAAPVVSGEVNAFSGNRFGFAISKTCSQPELMLKWFDRQNVDTATKMTWRFGEEGLLWERDGDTVYMNYPQATEEMSVENMKVYLWQYRHDSRHAHAQRNPHAQCGKVAHLGDTNQNGGGDNSLHTRRGAAGSLCIRG